MCHCAGGGRSLRTNACLLQQSCDGLGFNHKHVHIVTMQLACLVITAMQYDAVMRSECNARVNKWHCSMLACSTSHVQLRDLLSIDPAQVLLMQHSSRSSKGVPKLVEDLFQAFASGEAGWLVLYNIGWQASSWGKQTFDKLTQHLMFSSLGLDRQTWRKFAASLELCWKCPITWYRALIAHEPLELRSYHCQCFCAHYISQVPFLKHQLILYPLNFSRCPFKCCRAPRVWTRSPNEVFAPRESILQLADMLESSGGWNPEKTFSKWVSQQEWRQCLPPIFEFTVERAPLII